jgi:hypothetical protein
VRNKDGSGASSGRISTDFRSSGFGFGIWFSLMDFRVRIPESQRIFYFTRGSPSGPETIWPTKPINDPRNLNLTPQSLSLTTLTQPGTRRPPRTREQARSREGHSRTALDASHQEPSPSSLYLSLCGALRMQLTNN